MGSVATVALVLPFLAPGQVRAQETAQKPAVEEIVVTGSRIARRDFVSASPIVTVPQELFLRQSTTSPDQFIQTLPQVKSSLGASSNNPANRGIASINLHGLGSNRTLVLVDGRRTIGADGNSTVDISQFPPALIQSVEIITGGASAVYGSDAVAGVANFKLNDRIEGLQASTLAGITEEGDGRQLYADAVYGWQWTGGRAVVYGSAMDRDKVLATDRPATGFSRSVVFDASGNYSIVPQVSARLPDGAFVPALANLPSQAAVDAVFARYGIAPGSVARNSPLGVNPDNSLFQQAPLRNYRGPFAARNPYYPNFAEGPFLQLPTERLTLGALGRLEVGGVELYGRATYVNSNVGRAISPNSISVAIPLSNPFIPADLRSILASRPNPNATFTVERQLAELGPRRADFETDQVEVVLGAEGELAAGWRFDVHASVGRVERDEVQPGTFLASRLTQALSAPDGGQSLCSGGFDLFGAGGLSQSCVDFISYTPQTDTRLQQFVGEGSLTGDLFTLPAGDVGVAFGASFRRDTYELEADPEGARGNAVGFRADQAIDAAESITEVFGEIAVPLLKDLPLIRSLEVIGGYRYSDYKTFGGVDAYKAELIYAPFDELRFRGSYQRAVRAPNFNEAFLERSTQNTSLTQDPCNFSSTYRRGQVAGVDPARVRQLCIAQGIPASAVDSYVGPTAVTGFITGNRNLEPETADTYTVGLVLAPSLDTQALADLTFTIDYFDIDLKDAIIFSSPDPFVQRCYNFRGGNPGYDPGNPFCQVFTRNAAGNVTNTLTSYANIGGVKVAGVDMQVDWSLPLSALGLAGDDKRLDLNFLASRQTKAEEQTFATDPFDDFLGTIGNGVSQAFPKWRTTLSAQLTWGDFSLATRWRYLSAMETRAKRLSPALNSLGTPSMHYLDVTAGATLFDRYTLRLGVENLANHQPPIFSTPIDGVLNTDPNTFDTLGRRYFARLSVSF